MKAIAVRKDVPPAFIPVQLTLEIEEAKELKLLHDLCSLDTSIPKVIVEKVPSCNDEDKRILASILQKIANALRTAK